jgi:hypothetical protein
MTVAIVLTGLAFQMTAPGSAAAAMRPAERHRAAMTPLTKYCSSGAYYTVLTNHGNVFDGFGTAIVDHNGSSQSVTFTATVSATATATLTLGASGSFNLDAIVADAQGSLSAQLAVSVGVSGSDSASTSTPGGSFAIFQYGDYRFYNYGNYEVLTSDCSVTTNVNTYTWIPEKAVGIDTTVNTTGDIPWQQNNA